MKKAALIYALWEKNLTVLQQYLDGRQRVVIIPAALDTEAMREMVEQCGSELWVLPDGADATSTSTLLERLQGEVARQLGFDEDEYSRQMLAVLQREVLNEMPLARNLINALEALPALFEIEITALNEDVLRDGKLLALWSRSKKIPVLQIAHGSGIGSNYAGEVSLSDHVGVPSQRSAEYFSDLGVAEANIHVVGNPHWDIMPAVAQRRDSIRTTLGDAYNLPLNQTWMVWASSWNAHLSLLDNRDYREQMAQACETLLMLRKSGMHELWLVYKDRVAGDTSTEKSREDFLLIAQQYGVAEWARYALDDARYWVGCADVVLSYDSNVAIEALLVDVPAVNLMSDFGCVAGGGYGIDDGVLVLEPTQVIMTLMSLFQDRTFRQEILAKAHARKSYFHDSGGNAAKRIAELIRRVASPLPEVSPVHAHAEKQVSNPTHVWQQYLNIESSHVDASYYGGGRADLANMFTNYPATAIDIGCGAGANGYLLKQRFPGCKVWGIEANKVGANLARERLDKVLVGMFEDFNLEREGMALGSLDGVLLADVLEHMYNPWDVMVKLRPYMSDKGQLVLSIPNVRNLTLLDGLSRGEWTYAASGLLDVTHIRFFTYKEILKFCSETGYRVVASKNSMDERCQNILDNLMPSMPGNVELEHVIYKNVSPEELVEMCTLQFYLLLEKDTNV
jgi:2-polyprenyl-3-methyl-5-hydroxy-6-metoxy-1,4-benzoquinol methylase